MFGGEKSPKNRELIPMYEFTPQKVSHLCLLPESQKSKLQNILSSIIQVFVLDLQTSKCSNPFKLVYHLI